eukprot:TRINITY_DN256_c1_g2_i6.p1 TRINITY_DN256_c1_g2~~TRINITY_DN256_c1_g2_i6.p1  ORF type:complete len:242 (-),score=50.17 TRINITY_DN256_c1_g2_i6:108-833(-)
MLRKLFFVEAFPVAITARKPFLPAINSFGFLRTYTEQSSGDQQTPRHIRIYTRTGDKGSSSLFNGERRRKDDAVFEALGATDELNSFVGLAREHCVISQNNLEPKLEEIQCRLLDIGAHVATPRLASDESKIERTKFDEMHVTKLESWIDEMETSLPVLRNFILPSGGLASSTLHMARSMCRRAERRVVSLSLNGDVDTAAMKYLNRLSDFLFVAARFAARHENKTETPYRKATPPASKSE